MTQRMLYRPLNGEYGGELYGNTTDFFPSTEGKDHHQVLQLFEADERSPSSVCMYLLVADSQKIFRDIDPPLLSTH